MVALLAEGQMEQAEQVLQSVSRAELPVLSCWTMLVSALFKKGWAVRSSKSSLRCSCKHLVLTERPEYPARVSDATSRLDLHPGSILLLRSLHLLLVKEANPSLALLVNIEPQA